MHHSLQILLDLLLGALNESPAQVFTLLQKPLPSILLDSVAKKKPRRLQGGRRSEIAICSHGLPDPQEDHALSFVRL
jgi:hypothetical protein